MSWTLYHDAQIANNATLLYDNQTHTNSTTDSTQNNGDVFQKIVRTSLRALIRSDVERPDGSSSQGRWMDMLGGKTFEHSLDRLVIKVRVHLLFLLVLVWPENNLFVLYVYSKNAMLLQMRTNMSFLIALLWLIASSYSWLFLFNYFAHNGI